MNKDKKEQTEEQSIAVPFEESSAKWIWLNSKTHGEYCTGKATTFVSGGKYSVCVFEKTFSSHGENAEITISADTKYVLKINGNVVARGPAVVGGDYGNTNALPWCFADFLSCKLSDGENKISVEVQALPEVQSDYSSGMPGLIMSLKFSDTEIYTDKTWTAKIDGRYVGVYTSGNDTTREYNADSDVIDAGFADYAYRNVEILNPALKQLKYQDVEPVSITPFGEYTVYDYGKILAGYITVGVSDGASGTFTVEPSEVSPIFDRAIRCKESITANGNAFTYSPLRLYGFRYIFIKGTDKDKVKINVSSSSYPSENTGDFKCNNQNVNTLMECSLNALSMCRQTYELDSPVHQEALGCAGDYYIESMMAYAYLGEYSLSRADIIRIAKYLDFNGGKMFHTAYTLIYLRWVREHYRYTKDIDLLNETEPAIKKVLFLFESYCNDLWIVNPPDYMFIDWVEKDGFNLHHAPSTLGEGALNAFWYDALCACSEIYEILGDGERAEELYNNSQKVKQKYTDCLFDGQKGLFSAGTQRTYKGSYYKPIDDSGKTYYISQNNILAVAFGIIEGESAKNIMRKVMTDGDILYCQPYFYYYLFNALESAGLYNEYAEKAISDLMPICVNGSLKEVFSGFDTLDYSHAWGGGIVYSFVAHMLGVKPTGDGFTTYQIKPLADFIGEIEGKVPTPWGSIFVKVKDGRVIETHENRNK